MRAFILAAVGAALLAGCSGGQIETGPEPLPANDDSATFLNALADEPTVSEDQALQGILLMIDGADTNASFDGRVSALRQRGIAPGDWDFAQSRPLTRGRLAYMAYQAAGMDGGVITALAGPSQRYCLREMEYRKMMAPGPGYVPVTGMEYVAVLSRAHAWMTTGEVPIVLQPSQSEP
jgi:hypothetical protein